MRFGQLYPALMLRTEPVVSALRVSIGAAALFLAACKADKPQQDADLYNPHINVLIACRNDSSGFEEPVAMAATDQEKIGPAPKGYSHCRYIYPL